MALVSTRGPVYFPPIDHTAANGSAPAGATFTLDASAEKLAFIVTFWQAGTLHLVRFRTATVTVGDTMKVSFQDVDPATGDPDGVVDQFRTIVIANGDDNVGLVTGILSSDGTDSGTKRTVTMGQQLAIVIEFNSFVAGNLQLAGRLAAPGPATSGYTYADHFTAAWAKAQMPVVAVEYSDGSYAPLPYVDSATGGIAAETFNSGTLSGAGGDERGLIFQVPFSCKVRGFWGNLDIDNDAEVVLYDSDGTTPLETVALDPNNRAVTHSLPYHVPFATERTLLKDTSYYLALKPGASNSSVMVSTWASATAMNAAPGGQQCHYVTRTDGGAWSPTTTKRPLMGVIISALDDGTTTSSGSGGQGQLTPLAA